jgi:hypothetical protein
MIRPWLFIGDAHNPYEDKRWWKLVLAVGKWLKPHGILIIGDFIDFYQLSFFDKDFRRKESIEYELDYASDRLKELDELEAKDKRYCEGNHEYRLMRYINQKAPALGKIIPGIEDYLRLKERGWQFFPYKKVTKIGHCRCVHDVGTGGQYAAFKASLGFQKTCITGHTHRAGVVYSGSIENESKASMMTGWGGDKSKADYADDIQKKDWMLGFGLGYENTDDDSMHMNFIPFIDYTCVVNGKLFKAPFVKQSIKSYKELVK